MRLLPFSMGELKQLQINYDRDKQIHYGFLPRIYDQNQDPFKANRNYLHTYVERDLRQLIRVKDLGLFENFLRLLSGRIGQIANLHSISNDLGVSSPTISQWLSILEASFIIFRLTPYFENFGKRIIKSPKIFFTDVGLASYLLGIENPEQVSRDPLLGGLFENLVVMEAIKARLNKGLDPNLYFYRDNNGNEVDLLFRKHNLLVPIEIKAAMTYNDNLVKGIRYFQKISYKATKGFLVYAGEMEFNRSEYRVVNFRETCDVVG